MIEKVLTALPLVGGLQQARLDKAFILFGLLDSEYCLINKCTQKFG